ncbi:MAG: TrmH family RNA methyltransferase [Bacteroidota bacterium]
MRKLAHEEIPRLAPDDLDARGRHPVVVIVDNIRSVHNVGSIFRTADAAWIEHIYICGYAPTPRHKGVLKTALGAEASVPWSYAHDIHDTLDALEKAGFTVAALEITDTPTLATSLDLEQYPLALVLGNEVAGVTDEVLARCALSLEIPQYGMKQSMNVSVAFGIAVFDIVRRFRTLRSLPAYPTQTTRSTSHG